MGRIATIAAIIACLVLAGCGKEAEEGIETMVSAPRRSATLACDLERQNVETAVDAYTALHGEPPTQTSDLLEVLAETPTYIEIEDDGTLGLTDEAERRGCTLPE